MKCGKCGRKVESRREEIEHVLEKHSDKITSHEKDELKRELNSLESEDSSSSSLPLRKLGFAAVMLVVLVGGGYALTSAGFLSFSAGGSAPTGNAVASIDVEGEPVLGNASAPVTIVAYEDFECPVCKRFDSNVLPRIEENYIDTGRAKLVWKDFPLTYAANMHPWSDEAAVAMECVYREDSEAFWPVKDRVFDDQGALSEGNVQERVKTWAEQEGVDASTVQACIDGGDAEREVRTDFQEGRAIGVRGTPTVFVDGVQIRRWSDYQSIGQAIEQN